MSQRKGPTYHSSHQKEEKSKADFQRLLEPCVVNWFPRDYGVDGMVTLYADLNRDDDSVQLDNLYFHVQIKSTTTIGNGVTEFPFSVSVDNIKDWTKSNVSVLLVVNNLNDGSFFGTWMDGDLINILNRNNPDWITKQTVSLRFVDHDLIEAESIEKFREYLISRKANQSSMLPGQYFSLRDQVKAVLDKYKSIVKPFGFRSTEKGLEELTNNLDLAIYRIAIAGPARSGKSTLINALLQEHISPIGIFQTTGVPIQIIPGKKNQVNIYFKDGTKHIQPFSQEIIVKYVSQDENRTAYKDVKFVSVEVVNAKLERGISFFDVPGLDDPDDEIFMHASSYVKTFNAVIYVIDVTPHATGGFSFKRDFKNQILDMTSSLDRVFLVFNKMDFLAEEQLVVLKDRIVRDLKKFGLYEKVHNKVHYVSAKRALEKRVDSGESISGIGELEESVWAFLLEEHKSGTNRLISVVCDIDQAREAFAVLLKARLMDSSNLEALEDAIKETEKKFPEINALFQNKHQDMKDKVILFLQSQVNSMLAHFEYQLKQISADKVLPSGVVIKKYLMDQINACVGETNKVYQHQAQLFKNDIDIWVEGNLKKVKEVISGSQTYHPIDTTAIENMTIPDADFSASWSVGFLGGLVAAMLNPYGAAAIALSALASFLASLFATASFRRDQQISRIVDSTRRNCATVFADLGGKYEVCIDEITKVLIEYANDKIRLYFSDINVQIQGIESGRLTQEEKMLYNDCFLKLEELNRELKKTSVELVRYK